MPVFILQVILIFADGIFILDMSLSGDTIIMDCDCPNENFNPNSTYPAHPVAPITNMDQLESQQG